MSKLHQQLCKYLKFRSGYLIDLSLKKLKKCLEKKESARFGANSFLPKDRNIERTNGDVILNIRLNQNNIKSPYQKEVFSYD